MFTHVVFFKLKRFSSEVAEDLATRLRALPDQIPAIRDLEVGIDVDRSARAWDLALIVRFDSAEDLPVYAEHPAHRAVVEHILEVAEASAVVDYPA